MIFDNFEVYGIQEVVQPEQFAVPAMLKISDKARLGMSSAGQRTAFKCCGCEVRFVINTGKAVLKLDLLQEDGNDQGECLAIVMLGSFYSRTVIIKPGVNEIEIEKSDIERLEGLTEWQGYPFSPKVIRVLLPDAYFAVPTLEGDVSLPLDDMVPDKIYLAYGSSITNAGCCFSPYETYVFKLSRLLKSNQRNLGFPGTAFLEPSVADYIADKCEFDFLTLELGANLVWDVEKNCWGDPKEFEKKVDYFISRIFEAHKDAVKVVTDMFLCGADMVKDPEIFEFRDIVRNKMMDVMKEYNNDKCAYINGKRLLTKFDGLSTDMLHPSSYGMNDMADNLHKVFQELDKFEYRFNSSKNYR